MAMAAARENQQSTHVDDLFDYDAGLDHLIESTERDTGRNDSNPAGPSGTDGDNLGLDEEVKVTKKRQPVSKLDEDR